MCESRKKRVTSPERWSTWQLQSAPRERHAAVSSMKRSGNRYFRPLLTPSPPRGMQATSIRDVADAVGMLGGSLYYYIKTKEDLLFALINDFHRIGKEGVQQAEEEAGGRRARRRPRPAILRAVFVRGAEINLRSRALSTVFYNDFLPLER